MIKYYGLSNVARTLKDGFLTALFKLCLPLIWLLVKIGLISYPACCGKLGAMWSSERQEINCPNDAETVKNGKLCCKFHAKEWSK